MHPASTRVVYANIESTRGGLRAGIQNPDLTESRIFFADDLPITKNSGMTQVPTPEQSSEKLCRLNNQEFITTLEMLYISPKL
jgi:hypothetical protein